MIYHRGLLMLALLIGGFFSCEFGQQTPLNPNGDSELALLMRQMESDAQDMKKFITTGRVPAVNYDHQSIFTATPTEAGKTEDPEFITMATAYLEALTALKTTRPDRASADFNSYVDMCLSCHKSMCPGPVVRIEKLYVEDQQ